jgi:small subunit ribosomal protein S18
MAKPNKKRQTPEIEDINYKNIPLLMNYLDGTNKILGRKQTGLEAKKQRKLQNAVKQARSLGLIA